MFLLHFGSVMSTDKKSKSASHKDKKIKRKSISGTSLPSETAIKSHEPMNVPLKAKADAVRPEKRVKKTKQKGPSPLVSSVPETEKVEEEKDESEQEENEDLHLHGFSTDDDDSSDEDDDIDNEAPALDISKLPTIAKDDATVKRRLEKAKRQNSEDRGVVYIGRVPHGFYEDQMRGYFSQFGDVTRVRLSRNKK
ncbi:hypothetical protein C0992_012989, partial [Termitomyces sp. T32_za158]